MDKKIKRISQVGVIVSDLDRAIEAFRTDFGISEWNVFDANQDFGELLVDEKPGKLNIRGAITGELDGVEIELIQPTGEGPYADWLAEHGPGVHHFAVIMPDRNAGFQNIIEREKAAGRKPWVQARMAGGEPGERMDFAYLDRRADMGVIMEIYNENRE